VHKPMGTSHKISNVNNLGEFLRGYSPVPCAVSAGREAKLPRRGDGHLSYSAVNGAQTTGKSIARPGPGAVFLMMGSEARR
jgi:hypothetical protein